MRCHALSVLPTLSALLICGFATPLASRWDRMKVKHAWDVVPKNWQSLGHPTNQTTIDLHLALKSHREDAMAEALYEVSDLQHSRYGAHLSKEQFLASDTTDIPSSSTSMTLGGSWLRVISVSVSQANRILGASYQLYQHVETNDTVLRTISYSLPEVLHGHIQTVVPTTNFGSPLMDGMRPRMQLSTAVEARGKAGSVLSSRDEDIIAPSYLRSLYNTLGYAPKATDRNALGIAGYGGDFPSQQDLALFMTECRTDGEDATFTVMQVNGGIYDPAGNPAVEANLNLQYAEAMAYPTRTIYYSTGGTPDDIPQTISTSYGGYEHTLSWEYVFSVCTLFGQLGPWVTSVGGTTGHDPEVAASLSGGGFSIHFQRHPYQDNAVSNFLQNLGDKHSGLYNPQGRGYPDISSQAVKLLMAIGGKLFFVSGTSGSVPTVAGIISLLNDHLISKGSQPLGFLNPWLYGTGLPGLTDITSGSNPGCNTDGFPAIAGWDPVTGLGTLDLAKLEEMIDDQLGRQIEIDASYGRPRGPSTNTSTYGPSWPL
ncbi:subtilisin-like protein [Lactarius hatsudake]|nr:subtilisin-like protein [Lactarius hatsudake]